MASYRPLYTGEIPIDLQADRQNWELIQFAHAIEVTRKNLKGMLDDLESANTYILDQGFSRYLGFSSAPSHALQHFTDAIMKPLRQVLEWQWVYWTEFLDSASTGITQLSNQVTLPNILYICFYRESNPHNLASAVNRLHSIQICADWMINKEVCGDILENLRHHLRVGQSIEPIHATLTSVLLHECLHIANSSIVDVHIRAVPVPHRVQRNLIRCWDRQHRYFTCYGEYECRILPELERQRFEHAYAEWAEDYRLSYVRLPLQNAESIKKALVTMWLSQKRPDLNFFPEDRYDPKIE